MSISMQALGQMFDEKEALLNAIIPRIMQTGISNSTAERDCGDIVRYQTIVSLLKRQKINSDFIRAASSTFSFPNNSSFNPRNRRPFAYPQRYTFRQWFVEHVDGFLFEGSYEPLAIIKGTNEYALKSRSSNDIRWSELLAKIFCLSTETYSLLHIGSRSDIIERKIIRNGIEVYSTRMPRNEAERYSFIEMFTT